MPLNHCIRQGDHEDLTKERKKCTFDTNEMAFVIYGGREIVEKMRSITAKIENCLELDQPINPDFLPREKRMEEVARLMRMAVSKAGEIVDMNEYWQWHQLVIEGISPDGFPGDLNFKAFLPTLRGQADEDLASEFIPRAERFEIIGAYAQTEMAHGTCIRDLETTATFDKERQEFVINTPSRSAMKWWPGNMGKAANYAVVGAQLIIDGKSYGPHNFLVQLRNERTHEPMTSITVGDIGPKMAFNAADHGFLSLDHVRIPRRQMLMKFAKVSPGGKYSQPLHAKLNYATMMHIRTNMITEQGAYLAKGVTIAVRYSAVRRQGRIEQNTPEVQILDYQTQQYRLFPQIALAYAILATGAEVKELHRRSMKEIERGNADLLPELHVVVSGLKAVVTFLVGQGIEQCRMACGGHGYSLTSGLPQLYTRQIAGCTYEGENMVMLQQVGKFLYKSAVAVRKGEKVSELVAYLEKKDFSRSSIGTPSEVENEVKALLDVVEHSARRLVFDACDLYSKRMEEGETRERAWNGVTVEMNRAARVHTRLYICRAFARKVQSTVEGPTKEALSLLLSLFLHYTCVDLASHLMEDRYCTGEQIRLLKERLYEDLRKIRPIAVSLVDSFDFSDRSLHSVLGRRDGNVYEAIYEWAKDSELNYTDVLPAFTKHMQPLMESAREKAKL